MKNLSSLLILIILVSGLYFINERGIRLPLVSTYKGAFYTLFIIGLILCTNSPLKRMFEDVWYKPFYLLGAVIGVLILVLLISVILKFTFNINIAFINSYRQAFIFLAILTFTKSIITLIHRGLFNG